MSRSKISNFAARGSLSACHIFRLFVFSPFVAKSRNSGTPPKANSQKLQRFGMASFLQIQLRFGV